MIKNIPLFLSASLLFLVVGCGFHLRGSFNIPPELRVLQISPNLPYDPLQRLIRQSLKSNCVQLVDENCPGTEKTATLIILSQYFADRNVGYGTDGQINRAIVQLTVQYQVTSATGKIIVPSNIVQVERPLTVNPNAVLGTDNERIRVHNELYADAALQLLRQISVPPISP